MVRHLSTTQCGSTGGLPRVTATCTTGLSLQRSPTWTPEILCPKNSGPKTPHSIKGVKAPSRIKLSPLPPRSSSAASSMGYRPSQAPCAVAAGYSWCGTRRLSRTCGARAGRYEPRAQRREGRPGSRLRPSRLRSQPQRRCRQRPRRHHPPTQYLCSTTDDFAADSVSDLGAATDRADAGAGVRARGRGGRSAEGSRLSEYPCRL